MRRCIRLYGGRGRARFGAFQRRARTPKPGGPDGYAAKVLVESLTEEQKAIASADWRTSVRGRVGTTYQRTVQRGRA